MIIEGAISVKAALEGKVRPIKTIYIDAAKESRDIDYIIRLCKFQKRTLRRVPAKDIEALTTGKSHGGIIADVQTRRYQRLENFKDLGWVVLIEGVEDPFNLGQMIRTAYAAGAQGVLLNHRDLAQVEPTLLKSSGGTFDRFPIVLSQDLKADLVELKSTGYQLVMGMRQDSSLDYRSFNYPSRLILAIGGELRGLSRAVKEEADASIVIRYPGETKVALNAVSACAVLCFEVSYQRQQKP